MSAKAGSPLRLRSRESPGAIATFPPLRPESHRESILGPRQCYGFLTRSNRSRLVGKQSALAKPASRIELKGRGLIRPCEIAVKFHLHHVCTKTQNSDLLRHALPTRYIGITIQAVQAVWGAGAGLA